ncbi:methyltransferase domain-containing protein [Bacteroidetes/Chlorobi group bacterium Naka2016]|jgi:chemotaxis protein methyltransferase CheR|nr:MAG: methyltransferase domain-containing protein [Bacteroidetes/Chlorobi group bacterium Naka2016]
MAFSFFFRDHFILDRLADILSKDIFGQKEIKIWDAGCALGQEPFTFAILLSEKVGYFTFKKVKIFASDIDETGEFQKTIENGIYPYQDLSRIPKDIFEKYFTKVSEDKYRIVPEIHTRVKFVKHNLLGLNPFESNFDAIICKNVLLHFSYLERVKVLQMFYNTLKDGKYLALEQTQKIPTELEDKFKLMFSNVTIYQKV